MIATTDFQQRPLLYRDMATSFFKVSGLKRKQGWDNAAWDDLGFDGPPAGETVETIEVDTADECARACDGDGQCFSWTHQGRTCSLVYSIRIGKARYLDSEDAEEAEKDLGFTAGWATKRIRVWIDEHDCETEQWVKPSTERIF